MLTYRVFLDGKPYEVKSSLPTMSLAEMLPKLGENGTRNLFMEQNGERVYLAHASAVDLRNEPRLYVDLPAQMQPR